VSSKRKKERKTWSNTVLIHYVLLASLFGLRIKWFDMLCWMVWHGICQLYILFLEWCQSSCCVWSGCKRRPTC